TIDTTAAVESAPDLATASDSGKSNSDDLTNVTSPTLTGTVTDLNGVHTVASKNGTTPLGFATVDHVAGTWSFTVPTTLVDGIHSLTAPATDNALTLHAALPIFTIDTTAAVESAPDLATASDSGKSNSDDLTNVTSPTLTGTVTDLN